MYLADSNGKKSLTATLSIIAFVIVMIKLLVNNSAIQVGTFAYSFGAIDATEIAAVLGPILGTYAFRRYTDSRFGPQPAPWEHQQQYYEESYEEVEAGDMGGRPGDGRP